ncbi:folylpolyglutamate synthase 1 [Calliopsis andreniformis]|uniref:folylpolyglutamate synthase 1 n=1 Tax=Calliopsis andreniformis TaxID=337506 RepID=UPI003FCD1EF3
MLNLWGKVMQNISIKRYASSQVDYEAAMKALHSLQSNAEYLKSATNKNLNDEYNLFEIEKYLLRLGITLEKLDTLSVIHIAGTKGKGSTCAYTEAIVREHGFSTGFFSSPHLVTVRERIRIDGQPISQSCFTEYFWKVYKKLEDTKEHESDMPQYFKFLTVLMFHVFLDMNVDVAIIEVGIGGLKDCTNIVRNPVCVGITSLALDHTSLLGNTLEDIAYQKSGIFKRKAATFSVPQHPAAMSVLIKRALKNGCILHIVPPFEKYKWDNLSPILKITNNVQQQNASLAIQIATAWLMSKCNQSSAIIDNYNESIETHMLAEQIQRSKIVSIDKIAIGLSSCKWPGRMQILRSSIADFFLDGAHTVESIQCCISWFNDTSSKRSGEKILIFNTSGKRDSDKLLLPLKSVDFHKAYFAPNFAGVGSIDDETNNFLTDEQKLKCKRNSEIWGTAQSSIKSSVFEVLQEIKQDFPRQRNSNNEGKVQILVTGSLHLIGAVLAVLDPHLTLSTKF